MAKRRLLPLIPVRRLCGSSAVLVIVLSSALAMPAPAALGAPSGAPAATGVTTAAVPAGLAAFARSAGEVFRGTCVAVREGSVEVGGARLAATVYTFEADAHLKGEARRRVEFRQIGRPAGGPGDLGYQVGLPTYEIGSEYLLFLLPPSAAGLTSPAGAAEGAFRLVGDRLQPLAAGHGLRSTTAAPTFAFEAVVEAVRQELTP